ncbi:TonB C-terminal domain-containing protein [Tumidithrix helvetica PCC 7403]|uniref:energy transducer TonB family protein n=1 Tax=Tumidithrix helvetica TaxID=3457545 RepID=UPI003C9B431F
MKIFENSSDLENIQQTTRQKTENRTLVSILFISFIGSACLHVAAMVAPVPSLWKSVSKEKDDTIEVVVENPDKAPVLEEKAPEIVKEPEQIPQDMSIEVAPAAIALAPEITTTFPEGKDAPAPDNLKPLATTGASDTKIQSGGGSIINKDGTGSGFGNAKNPTGFVFGGKPFGNPNGKKDGVQMGVLNGKIHGTGVNSTPPPSPPITNTPLKLECLSCPKPQYRGKEGTPRVTYDIDPDGKVTNIRLRQSSGDAQTDRETMEAMSRWQFNPKTVPEGGRTDVKVRVTFEENGSQFQQRNNEERRRREVEQQQQQNVLDRERQRLEAEPPKSSPVNIKPAIEVKIPEPPSATSIPVEAIAPPPAPSVTEPMTRPEPAVLPPPPPVEPVLPPPPAPIQSQTTKKYKRS